MEKLIVKNFGPIKDAEIDLTKYVVFIGDTSTGKSVLAKLIAIFRDFDIAYSIDRFNEFKKQLLHYNIDFEISDSKLVYLSDSFEITINSNDVEILQHKKLNEKDIGYVTKSTIMDLSDKIERLMLDKEKLTDDQKKAIDTIIKDFAIFNNNHPLSLPVYIPAERILISLIGSSISGLWANNVALPSCFKEFAAKLEVARQAIKKVNYKSFKFKYDFKDGIDYITYSRNKLQLNKASSGIQSLLPLLLVIDHELNINKAIVKTIVVEEPELNLFPVKQKLLIEHIIKITRGTKHNLVITTHSPYVLSVLDTLILACNTFVEFPDFKERISTIVPEEGWLNYKDISVYEVKNDGTIQSIKNEEFKSIDTNAIDRVSNIISEEFDKLTELRYAH